MVEDRSPLETGGLALAKTPAFLSAKTADLAPVPSPTQRPVVAEVLSPSKTTVAFVGPAPTPDLASALSAQTPVLSPVLVPAKAAAPSDEPASALSAQTPAVAEFLSPTKTPDAFVGPAPAETADASSVLSPAKTQVTSVEPFAKTPVLSPAEIPTSSVKTADPTPVLAPAPCNLPPAAYDVWPVGALAPNLPMLVALVEEQRKKREVWDAEFNERVQASLLKRPFPPREGYYFPRL